MEKYLQHRTKSSYHCFTYKELIQINKKMKYSNKSNS